MKCMPDTNICIYVIANRSVELGKKFRQMVRDDISVPVIVASELAYGLTKSRLLEKKRAALELFLSSLSVQAMADSAMWHYADLHRHLERQVQLIGESDQWIAAQALATDSVMVTNNRTEFDRVSGLGVENWI